MESIVACAEGPATSAAVSLNDAAGAMNVSRTPSALAEAK
jgi:hypothetical protein